MAELKKILVVEDELTNSILLKRILTKAGYSTIITHNGSDALKHLDREKFDAVLTDWMMPQIDGIELIRKLRDKISPIPFIMMITALVSEGAKDYALESGADDFISKPIDVDDLLMRLKDGLARLQQGVTFKIDRKDVKEIEVLPPFVAVVIATSTGGPPALVEIFKTIPDNIRAAIFIVQHGPSWMLETFAQRLQKETSLKVSIAVDNVKAETGNVYIAPGDKHLRIDSKNFHIILDEGPKENFVRPAADPLFRSAAEAFGRYCVGVVTTGLGRDGAQGAAQIAGTQGQIIVQDPATAVAQSMPNTVVSSGIPHKLVPLPNIGKVIAETVFPIAANLKINLEKQKKN